MFNINTSKVSVVIPTYGRPLLLKRAINSVINQTYSNVEIIVVDDNGENSPNQKETQKMVSEYENLVYLKLKQNSGGAVARNLGAKRSSGEYICFLDDDDEFLPTKLEKQVGVFKESQNELSVVGCYADILGDNQDLIRKEVCNIKGDVYFYQLKNNVCTTSIAMIRSKYFKMVGGFDDVSSSQEHRLFIKIFAVNPYYDYVPESLVKIYHHAGERISTGAKKADGAIELYKYVRTLIEQHDSEEQRSIHIAHHKNIIRAYMVNTKNKTYAFSYLLRWVQIEKKFRLEMLKYLFIIILGVSKANKLSTLLK